MRIPSSTMRGVHHGSLGSLWTIVKEAAQATGYGVACYAGDQASCIQAANHAQAWWDEVASDAGPEFESAPAGAPANIVALAFVNKVANDAADLCACSACAEEVRAYVHKRYDAMIVWWRDIVQFGEEGQWTNSDYQFAADQLNGYYNEAYANATGDGVKDIVAKYGPTCGANQSTPSGHGGPFGTFVPVVSIPVQTDTSAPGGGGASGAAETKESSVLPTVLGVTAVAALGWVGWRVYKRKPIVPKF